ncbi:MAG: hypothetical protein PVJ05_05915 [Candidatus Thorarchaeota archaeon]|jgi:hypothetical protein
MSDSIYLVTVAVVSQRLSRIFMTRGEIISAEIAGIGKGKIVIGKPPLRRHIVKT